MWKLIRRLVREDDGQDLVEYAMLLALIALIVVGGVTTFGGVLNDFYEGLSGRILSILKHRAGGFFRPTSRKPKGELVRNCN